MAKISLTLTLFMFLTCLNQNCKSENTFSYVKPTSCLVSNNDTFSGVKLGCVKCHWDVINGSSLTSSKTGKCSACPTGYYWKSGDTCKYCSNGTVTEGQRSCLQCSASYPFNQTTQACDPCPQGHIHLVRKPNGGSQDVLECVKCVDGMTPSRSSETCEPCHPSFPKELSVNGNCTCADTVINGICLPPNPLPVTFDPKNMYKIRYDNVDPVESKFLTDNVIPAYHLCKKEKNETACQILANSCTLQVYFSGEDNSCKLLEFLDKNELSSGVRSVLPKVIYEDHYPILQMPEFIPQEFTANMDEFSSDFNISVARYLFTGEFLGLTALPDLLPCQGHLTSKRMKQKFGVTSRSRCNIKVNDFLESLSPQMEFWDVFLSIENEQKRTLYSIPVKIMNLKKNSVKINEADDKFQWLLVRRFFLADTIGGTEEVSGSSSKLTKTSSKVVRYVEKIHVAIQLQQQENAGRVFVPVVTVQYNQFTDENIAANSQIQFSYEVEYFMDMSRAMEDIKISVGVISSLAVLLAAIQTWTWNRRNGRAEIDLETILTLFLTSCGNIADAFVLVSFCTGLYWWIFFKKQVAVHVLLPQPNQERLIRDLLISAFALKIVDVLKMIGRQVTVDIFFIDWEKPKAGTTVQHPSSEDKSTSRTLPETPDDKQSVSIWRSYFVANEWNEIQSLRKINFPLQIILVLLFLEVFGLKYWGLHWPNMTVNPGTVDSDIPNSTVARFTTSTIVFLLLGLIQWLCNVGIYERFVCNKIQDFVDICTLANVSVFILSAKQYGYYIHGRSVHGFADTDMRTMVEQLNREEEDLCGRRGLVPTYDQQTFIISIPKALRLVYDQVLQPLYASSKGLTYAASSATGGSKGSATTVAATKSGSASSQLNQSAHAYHSMNRFLTSFLEHSLSDIDYEVSDKSFIETTLDMEFQDNGDTAIFYNDDGNAFASTLFYGNEHTLFLFDLYVFNFVDLLTHNFVLAAIVTFLVDIMLKCLRKSLGKRNLARKTLIDRRFLI